MTEFRTSDWNPFLWAGNKLRGLEKDKDKDKEKEQGLRTRQAEQDAQTAEKAGGVIDVHFQGTLRGAEGKEAGHKAWLGPVIPAKPKSLEGVPSVRINPQTKKIEAYPEYQELKSKLQHFEESMAAARGNPHRVEFSGGM